MTSTGLIRPHFQLAGQLQQPASHGEVKSEPRVLRDSSAQEIDANLRAVFPETGSTIPLEVLSNYLAGARISLVQWWLEKRQPYAPENIAQTFHRLQRAAICEAFGLGDDGQAQNL